MKKTIALLILLCAAACYQQKSSFADTRDGKVYKTVKIGSQTWMAENLNYAAEGSRCYGDSPANCDRYGRLYDWKTAMKSCPKGWHIPSNEEWNELIAAVGGSEAAGAKLKAASGWNEPDDDSALLERDTMPETPFKGEDDYGFSALPGGIYDSYGDEFMYIGNDGRWWSASEADSASAFIRGMGYMRGDVSGWGGNFFAHEKSTVLYSARCLKD